MSVKRDLLLSVLYEVSNGICGAPHHAHVGKQLKGALLSMKSHIQVDGLSQYSPMYALTCQC